MKAGIDIKVSRYTLLLMMSVIVILLALFYLDGFGETKKCWQVDPKTGIEQVDQPGKEVLNALGKQKELRAPANLDSIMYLMYVLTAIPIVFVVIYQLVNFVLNLIDRPGETLKGLIGPILFVLLIVGSCVFADKYASTPLEAEAMVRKLERLPLSEAVAPEQVEGMLGSMAMTDAFLFMQYVLFAICVLVTVLSMSGVAKYINRVK